MRQPKKTFNMQTADALMAMPCVWPVFSLNKEGIISYEVKEISVRELIHALGEDKGPSSYADNFTATIHTMASQYQKKLLSSSKVIIPRSILPS